MCGFDPHSSPEIFSNPHIQENEICVTTSNALCSVHLIRPGWITRIPFEMTSIIVMMYSIEELQKKNCIIVILMLTKSRTSRGYYVHMAIENNSYVHA